MSALGRLTPGFLLPSKKPLPLVLFSVKPMGEKGNNIMGAIAFRLEAIAGRLEAIWPLLLGCRTYLLRLPPVWRYRRGGRGEYMKLSLLTMGGMYFTNFSHLVEVVVVVGVGFG